MSEIIRIWRPISFDVDWCNVNTDKFDNIFPSWERKRKDFSKNQDEYDKFLNQLKRKQAIDTGIIERMYNLKDGITETFIKKGFVESYLQHGDTDIAPHLLMSYLKDNFDAIDCLFDFVKSNRELTTGFIKELHALITSHQDTTEAIDTLGNRGVVSLLKGQYKTSPNNPRRESDDKTFAYCPPEQVASEMDMLVKIYQEQLADKHVLIRASYLHHAFVQIHPFQDGNGRVARLLASLVFIKDGLFPLALDRNEKASYINSLENADNGQYQDIITLFSNNQINSIEKALNYKIVEASKGYDNIISIFVDKIDKYNTVETEKRNKLISKNMSAFHKFIVSKLEMYSSDLQARINNSSKIFAHKCSPTDKNNYFYTKQIVEFAKKHDYYFNAALDKCWVAMHINITEKKKYKLVFSLHHYGYDNSTFALGTFLSYEITSERAKKEEKARQDNNRVYIDVPLEIKPLTVSSEKSTDELVSETEKYIEDCIALFLAYIANEL